MIMKIVLNKDIMRIEKEQDVVPFRNRVKEFAVKIGMSLVNQTKLITAAPFIQFMNIYLEDGRYVIKQFN